MNNHTPLDSRAVSVATALTTSGVNSYLIGYTDTVLELPARGNRNVMPGFSVHTYFNLDQEGLSEWAAMLEQRGHGPFPDRMQIFDPMKPGSRTAIYDASQSDTAFIADRTIECIREHSTEPWLIHATFLRPHPPWVAPRPYDYLYPPDQMAPAIRAPDAAAHPFLDYFGDRRNTCGSVAEIRALYLGLVTELDFQVGRIMNALRECGLLNRTLIIFTSDHGDMLGDHGMCGGGGCHDTAYQIPLIIADPKSLNRGCHVHDFTESVDIVPTVLEWMELPALERTDGFSMLPFVRRQHLPWMREAAFWEFDFRFAANTLGIPQDECKLTVWRTRTKKYVHFNALPPLLFDIIEDPGECFNRASDPAYGERMLELQRQLLGHRVRHSTQVNSL